MPLSYSGGQPEGIVVLGARELSLDMIAAAKITPAATERMMRRNTTQLVTRVRGKASGRPGPRRQTGDYRRSWTSVVTLQGDQVTGFAYTTKVQGPRLEYGFVGTDSLGRTYNQPPYPHAGPALAEQEVQLAADAGKLIANLLDGGDGKGGTS